MRHVRVEHWTCDEWDHYSHYWVPDTVTDEQIEQAVQQTINELREEAREIKADKDAVPPPPYLDWHQQRGRTVDEVLDEQKAHTQRYEAWKNAQHPMTSFSHRFAMKTGAIRGSMLPVDVEVTAHWGHNHGRLKIRDPKEAAKAYGWVVKEHYKVLTEVTDTDDHD